MMREKAEKTIGNAEPEPKGWDEEKWKERRRRDIKKLAEKIIEKWREKKEKGINRRVKAIRQQEGIDEGEARKKVFEQLEDEALRDKKDREREIEEKIKKFEPQTPEAKKQIREKLQKEAKISEIREILNQIMKDKTTRKDVYRLECISISRGYEALFEKAEKEWEEREKSAEIAEAREKIEKATEEKEK